MPLTPNHENDYRARNSSIFIVNGYLYAILAVFIWSGFILVSRMGGISHLHPDDIVAIRYLISSLILLPLWYFRFRFRLFDRKLVILSLTGGLAYSLSVYRGFELTPGSHASLLLPGLLPLLMTSLAVGFKQKKNSRSQTLGLFTIFAGILLLLFQKKGYSGNNLEGYLWITAAAFSWSLFSVLIKHWKINAWQATVSLSFYTCVFYLPFYLFSLTTRATPTDWSVLWPQIMLQGFYQGVLASIVQMLLFVKAVEKIGTANMGAMMGLVPLIAGTASIFLFSEPATSILVYGLILVSAGTFISSGLLNQLNFFQRKNTGRQHALRQYKNHQ